VKAGKSSLVNAILGEERAATDVLPLTPGAVRYTLTTPGQPALSVMDTAGFGNDGPSEADVLAAAEAAGEADVLLLVVPARSAARKPESDFLDRVIATVQAKPHLRMPPTVAVLSHVDLLTPAREWAPPYDWRAGPRPKEASIKEAVAAAADTFGGRVVDVLPVCTAPGKELGRDELLARVSGFLGEARGVAFLRTLHAEAAADKYRRVFGQAVNVGGALVKAFLDSRKK
jgi:predicted GTPase